MRIIFVEHQQGELWEKLIVFHLSRQERKTLFFAFSSKTKKNEPKKWFTWRRFYFLWIVFFSFRRFGTRWQTSARFGIASQSRWRNPAPSNKKSLVRVSQLIIIIMYWISNACLNNYGCSLWITPITKNQRLGNFTENLTMHILQIFFTWT